MVESRGHRVIAFETWRSISHRDSRSFVRLSHHHPPDNKQHRSVFHAQESTPIHTYEGFVLCKNCLKNFTTFVLRSPFRCCLASHNLLPTTKRTNSVLLPISSSNELALDEKKEIVFSRSLAIVRLFCGVLRTSSSSADGLPTPSLSLPGTAIASSRFANMRD